MAVLLDTNDFDISDRAAALHFALTSATAPHDLSLLGDPTDVHARLEHWKFGDDVAVLKQISSGIVHERSEKHDHTEGPERVVFVLHDGAVGSYVVRGRRYRLEPGAIYATELNSHYSYSRPGDGVARIVQVERDALGMSIEDVEAHALHLLQSPLYNLFRNHLADLCRDAEIISASGRSEELGGATLELAKSLLLTARSSPQDSATTAYLVERVSLYIRNNYWRNDLTLDEIAVAHQVSLSYLFKMWRGQPQSLMETLLGTRLEAARHLLILDRSLSVGLVAYRCGFENLSHFSRRFREKYGVTPREARIAEWERL
jgi:AraC-like DNA-binding protein